MRFFILAVSASVLSLTGSVFAQTTGPVANSPVDSASSGWTFAVVTPEPKKPVDAPAKPPTVAKVTPVAKPVKPVSAPTGKAKPAMMTFGDSFGTKKNGWLTGNRHGYEFDITNSSYFIRRLPNATQQTGRCYIKLPPEIDLNKSESFTISAEMTVDPGQSLEGGLLLGVKDVDNLTQFSLVDKEFLIIKSLRNGQSFANYMPGKPSPTSVPVRKDYNTLTVSRHQDKLHFYINGEEIESSPYEFRNFNGNGIGFVVGRSAMRFQNLWVRVVPATP